jgi:hypothetical protein
VTDSALGATISGGTSGSYPNEVTDDFGTVAGGYLNDARGPRSTVGGGVSNATSGTASTVAGGDTNEANADRATVGGGRDNVADGASATVPGGEDNRAAGNYSMAAGYRAKSAQSGTVHDGSFVWGDSSGDKVRSGAADQFVVQADDGIYFDGSASNPAGSDGSISSNGNLIETSTGAVLTSGGTWADSSSRATKTDLDPVDPARVLEGVRSLTVSEWRYEDGEDARHMGPMAEEFHETFGLGDDETLAALDTAGVALAAIQGLVERLGEKDDRIDELARENERLRAANQDLADRVAALERHVGVEGRVAGGD